MMYLFHINTTGVSLKKICVGKYVQKMQVLRTGDGNKNCHNYVEEQFCDFSQICSDCATYQFNFQLHIPKQCGQQAQQCTSNLPPTAVQLQWYTSRRFGNQWGHSGWGWLLALLGRAKDKCLGMCGKFPTQRLFLSCTVFEYSAGQICL